MRCCDSQQWMSIAKQRTRLVGVWTKEQVPAFDKRQIPINIDENLIMKLQFDDSCLTCNHQRINKNSKTYQTFVKTYQKLTSEQLETTLSVSISQIKEYIPRCIPCLGCRTSIDHFIKTILEYRHQALEPISINENDLFTLKQSPDAIYSLFYTPDSTLNSLIESIPKSKKNRRCHLHSLDKSKSFLLPCDWPLIWEMMNRECREEITLVDCDQLLDLLENYLHKHRFCAECKLKVFEAYELLLNNHDPQPKNGFCPALYEGLRFCSNDKHIHIQFDTDLIGKLISRAESDIEDSRRERHAKTLDIAQEEVLICIGIYLYERLEKISRTIQSEEQTWKLLFYVIVDCLRLNFEMIQEDFNATLKILCEEFSIKTPKKQKKTKKKAQRQVKSDKIDLNNQPIRIPRQRNNSYPMIPSSESKIPLSNSFETLCIDHSRKPATSCDRCSSTRTDLGYSSELDDGSSSGLCDSSSTTCVACLTDCKNCCALHEIEEASILSNDETVRNCRRTIELCDRTRKHKLKLELSEQYPFFNMDLKQTWDEALPMMLESTSFISDDDLREFFIHHTCLDMKRAQLRELFKLKFQTWQQQSSSHFLSPAIAPINDTLNNS